MKFNWKYLTTFEPAVIRGVWVAVLGLLTALGLKLSDAVSGKADAIIAAAIVLIPILQALWTRMAVTPVARVAELEEAATAPAPGGMTGPVVTTSSGATVSGLPTGPTASGMPPDPSEETP